MLCLPVKPAVKVASPASSSAHPMTPPRSRQPWSSGGCWLLILFLTMLSAIALAPRIAYAGDPSFTSMVRFGGVESTQSVVVGDLNGDGWLDIIQGNWGSPDAEQSSIYLNDQSGRFTQRSLLGNGENTTSVAVGDLNGDGFLDIVQGNNGQSYIYANDGQGSFSRRTVLGNGEHTASVAVGDLNGDGWLDIVQGNWSFPDTEQSYIYLNDQFGGFSQRISLGNKEKTASVAVGDLNADGWLDVVYGNIDQPSYVYLNNQQGGFLPQPLIPDSALVDLMRTRNIVLGDLNGDGFLDIVQTSDNTNDYIYLNDGRGGFTDRILPITGGEFAAALGDFNGDGFLDIVWSDSLQSSVHLNDGQGRFLAQGILLNSGGDTDSLAVGDLNGDGWLDIVRGNSTQQTSVYHLNDGQGGFTHSTPLRNFKPTNGVAVGDLNRDGFLDIVQGNLSDQSYVHLNDGQGGFNQQIPLGNGEDTTSVAVGDFNGDGWLDVVQGNYLESSAIYLGDPQGNFSQSIPFGHGEKTNSVAVGDLNGDGFLDIVQGNQSQQSYIYLGNPKGDFSSRSLLGNGENTDSVIVGDFNGDGFLDIAQGNLSGFFQPQQSYLYLNDGQGGFSHRIQLGNGEPTTSLAAGDLNGDGWLDIVQGNDAVQSYIYLNHGQGDFFTQGILLGNGENTRSVAVGDLNGDGWLDIVQGNGGQSYFYLNDRQGQFPTIGSPLRQNETTYSVAVGDFTGDRWLGIVQGNLGQSFVYQNDFQQATGLTNQSPRLSVIRPGPTGNANFFSTPLVLDSPTIPITYTLFDPEGDSVGRVEAAYSLNGGGKWLPAVATKDTITQNLSTGRALVRALTIASSIPARGAPPLQAKLTVTPNVTLADVELWLSITHTNNAALAITLQSPQGTQVPLVAAGQGHGQNFQQTRFSALATTSILSGSAPYTGTYQPVGDLTAFKGETSNGVWTLVITNTGASIGTLASWGLQFKNPPATHVFAWDTLASGFFGQSDNAVLRLVAYHQPLTTTQPIIGSFHYTHGVAGPYQQPYTSATTFPFRVRGTQVRVVDSQNKPVSNALVYRLPQSGVTGAELMPSASQPLTTAGNGYLGGRGALVLGDQLVALQPLRRGPNYTVYATSAAPTENGLALQPVTTPGVQTLQVSAAHPLVLFDLDVALEWDASNDGLFYEQLTKAIQRASAILYDVSDGQIALGEVRLHPARAEWLAADVVIYANNNLRPRASMGGVVDTAQDELYGLRGRLTNAYLPGQVRLGPIWDPFGQNYAELTQDWQRALAHELAHYLLYLPDNYLGVENGLLRITDCQGSVMTDAYNPGYSEFLTPSQWHTPNEPTHNPCLRTVAASLLTGRSDWETVIHFYPELHIPDPPLSGPALLPLNVTRVRLVAPSTPTSQPVTARNYDLRAESGSVTVLRQAQAYVLQSRGTPTITDDALLYLGSTGVGSDRILVRGALVGDKVCVIDSVSDPMRTGCTTVTPQSTSIQLFPASGWRPDIQVTPITSTTFQITVTQAVNVGQLDVQLLPAYGPIANAAAIQSVSQPLTPVDATHYTTLITTAYPALEGFVRVYAAAAPEQQQAITQFFLAEPWGPNQGWNGNVNRAWGANTRSLEAPAASGDGKVTILNLTDLLADTGATVLQAMTDLPYLPAWLTPVGPGYRFAANNSLARTIMFQYNQRDVPPGYEQTLTLYYLPPGSTSWQRLVTGPLATGVDAADNLATAAMPAAGGGEGIYALMATVELPPLVPGWNPINYPVGAVQSLTNSLAALGDAFTTVYEYQPGMSLPWPVYDRTIDPAFAPLVNTLHTMSLGHNYLIYATQTITPYIGVVGDGQAQGVVAATTGVGLVEPPATFYGPVALQANFAITAGMTIKAKIGEVICGESQLQLWQGQLVYAIQVKADTGDGCGRTGQPVIFEINGNPWPIMAIWDNRQVNGNILGIKVYLPMTRR